LPKRRCGGRDPEAPNAHRLLDSYLREVGTIAPLSREEEQSLARCAQAGDREAAHQIIEANLSAAARIAVAEGRQSYRGDPHITLDLIQAANQGLLKAVERFDPDRGTRLATYAHLGIKDAIRREQHRLQRGVRAPARAVRAYKEAEHELTQRLEREPTLDEMADELQTTRDRVDALARVLERPSRWGVWRKARTASSTAARLDDDETLDRESAEPFEVSPDASRSPNVLAELTARHENAALAGQLLEILEPREREVLELRYGFLDGKQRTLAEVGEKIGLTRERVRQIEAKALDRLRVHVRAMGLDASDVL
jgi:RNA polymerase primary sigma factor